MSDLLDQFDNGFTLVPAGSYSAVLSDAALDTTKEAPELELQWKLLSGGEEIVGRKIRAWVKFRDSTGKFLAWQLGVSGARSVTKELTSWEEIATAAFGYYFENIDKLHVLLKVEIENYKGKDKNQCVIDKVIDVDSVELDAFEASVAMPSPTEGIDEQEVIPF